MASTKVLDRQKKIIEIVWDSATTPETIRTITNQIKANTKTFSGSFDAVVDMTGVKIFTPDTQIALVEHQKEMVAVGLKRAAVVTTKAMSRMQLRRSAMEAGNKLETHWETVEEALAFLRQ